jgi:hypothetical protein
MAAAAGHHVAAGAPTAASTRAADLAAVHRTAAATSVEHHNAAGAPTRASTRAADFGPSGFGLPGYPTCAGVFTCLPSPTRLTGHPPPGFPPTRPLVADATWASPPPSTDSTLPSTIAAIQAALAASQERERAASRALDQERALAATLTAQMATVQRLILSPPPVDSGTPPPPQMLPTPLDSRLTTSPLSMPRPPDYRTSGPSCPSFWTRRPLTTLAGGGRSFSPCGATPSTTTSSTTSPPRRLGPGP